MEQSFYKQFSFKYKVFGSDKKFETGLNQTTTSTHLLNDCLLCMFLALYSGSTIYIIKPSLLLFIPVSAGLQCNHTISTDKKGRNIGLGTTIDRSDLLVGCLHNTAGDVFN